MTIKEDTIVKPVPTDELLNECEEEWELVLPDDYREFIKKYNGGVPEQTEFICNNHSYAITRFLCIIEDIEDNEMGWYDIGVVESEIGERLTDNEDLIGIEVLPIAELFAGDFVCMDFRNNNTHPCICIWDHEESDEFEPVTYKIADSFSEFLEMLV